MKTRNSILVVLFVLLTAQIASAYYCPSTGRWLSRDPIGEPGFETLRAANTSPPVGNTVSAQSARWIQRDPVSVSKQFSRANSNGDGVCFYVFNGNHPTDAIDALGLFGSSSSGGNAGGNLGVTPGSGC